MRPYNRAFFTVVIIPYFDIKILRKKENMKNTINSFYFRNWFLNSQYKNNFSIEGLSSLYDYLVDLEEDQNTEFNFDPVAFACAYSEYENFQEIKENYNSIETIQDLENNTSIIPVVGTDRLIIQNF